MQELATKPIHPWLLAAYPALAIAASNVGQVASTDVIAAVCAALAATTLLMLAFRAMRCSWLQAGLCAALLVFAFFAYGLASRVVDSAWIAQSDRNPHTAVLAIGPYANTILSTVWIASICLGIYLIVRASTAASRAATGFLNLLGIFLVLQVGISFAATKFRGESVVSASSARAQTVAAVTTPQRDIYYIILDGYARADILKKYYGFDNSSFIDKLHENGFSIDPASNANYYWTYLSLASSLNFDYLPEVLTKIDPDGRSPTEAYDRIRDSAASRFLKQRGYRFVHLQSTWGATLVNPYADQQIGCSSAFANEYYRALLDASWLRALHSRISVDLAACHEANFQAVADIAAQPERKFVFAHFLLPHHPYLFDSTGQVLRNATLGNQFRFDERLWERRQLYAEQLQFVNSRIAAMIEQILRRSATPPIIILQSDHGPQLVDGLTETERRQVRLANFAAYLFPEAPDLIPPGASPVNQFRYVFNHYFAAQLPILPQHHYYSPFRAAFKFREVSHLLQQSPQTAAAPSP